MKTGKYYTETSDYWTSIHHRPWIPPNLTKDFVRNYNMLCRKLHIENVRKDKDFEKIHNQYFKNLNQ